MESFDLGQLTSLDALLQEVSVTAAARRVGLSTPAMSHALARLRERLGDPLLVRAGRTMVLTPRAESLRPRIHTLVTEARQTLAPEAPFVPQRLERTFVVPCTDYVLAVLGPTIDRSLWTEAPGVALRFVPNGRDDAARLREGTVDLAVGIYGDLPPELRQRQLLTDRFVCVVREGNATVGKRLTLNELTTRPHVQIAPRGAPGGYIDDVLRERGLARRVVRAVPYFLTALQLVAATDYLLMVSERAARRLAGDLRLRILEPPLPLRPYALSLVWHPRFDADFGHAYLRDVFVRAAAEVATERHPAPRTRLDDEGKPRSRKRR